MTERNVIGTKSQEEDMTKALRRIQFGLVDLLRGPNRPVSPTVSIGPECFAASDGSVLCYKGENYTPQKPSIRVRLHNWLVRL